jgi:hypothetical protein
LQPVAAGPTKVGEYTPKLEVFTWAANVPAEARKSEIIKIAKE